MTIVKMVLRKMLKNKWFILFLLIGLLVSSALMSSIPMYTQGVLQKVFIKQMESSQESNGKFPGGFEVTFSNDTTEFAKLLKDEGIEAKDVAQSEKVKSYYGKLFDSFSKVDKYSREKLPDKIGIPALSKVYNYSMVSMQLLPEKETDRQEQDIPFARVQSLSDLEKHIKLVDGRMPKDIAVDGVYEVLISEEALNKLNVFIDKIYVLQKGSRKDATFVKIKPVGVFNVKEENDPYWSYLNIGAFKDVFFVDEKLMTEDFIRKSITDLAYASWYYAFDYHALKIGTLSSFISANNTIKKELGKIYKETDVENPAADLVYTYINKEKQLRTMLWSLNVPVIIVLCIYLTMVSKLTIEKEKNEISLLISRGASRIQVVISYFIESLILSIITIAAGPFLGLLVCKALGASNGFLEFVDRKAIDVALNTTCYYYTLIAIGIFILTLLIPAYKASKTGIVEHKRKTARGLKFSGWEKLFLDLILLGIAAYGYYAFNQRQNILKSAVVSAGEVKVDPILFLVPVLFILGASLLSLRLYPYLIKLIYWTGRKLWPPSLFATLVQVGRSSNSYQFLMVFIMLTVSIGIFSANSARTLNRNEEDKISYDIGTDIVLEPYWETIGGTSDGYHSSTESKSNEPIEYIEPDFENYKNLSGVEHSAKVLRKENVYVDLGGNKTKNASLMAVNAYDFGKVAWFRKDLLPHHINEYLNMLTKEESACLISKSMSETQNIKPGDSIYIELDKDKPLVFNVYGVIDYWPSLDSQKLQSDNKKEESYFIVTNLTYIQNNFPIEPYQVWLKLKPDGTRAEVYNELREKKLFNRIVLDSKQGIINFKNNPAQLAVNGSLTMGFIISAVICFLGFAIYWVLALKSRSLQFGILRAMGLSKHQLKFMMLWEQILTSGAAMFTGVFIGLVCSKIYVAFFKMSVVDLKEVIPFRVVSYSGDRIKVYLFIGFTLVLGQAILTYLLSKMKISNVIKLGED